MTISKSRQRREQTARRRTKVHVHRMTPMEAGQLKAKVRYMKANLPYITDRMERAAYVEEIKRLETVIQKSSMY